MKSPKILSLIFLLITCPIFFSYCDSGYDDISFLEENADFLDLSGLPDDIGDMPIPTKSITPTEALELLVTANAPEILACDLYLRTNPLNDRQLTTLPVFLLFHTNYMDYCSLFRAYLFYNQTSKMFFCKRSPFLESYLAVGDQNLLNLIFSNEISEIPEKYKAPVNIARFIKIEERRTGVLFQWLKNWNKTNLELDLPFLYQERNFILTESEKADLKALDIFPESEAESSQDVEKLIRKQVVADLIGFSDLKIKLGHQVVNLPYRSIIAGFEIYFPTAFALKKGMIGSDFSTPEEIPDLDLTKLLDLFIPEPTNEGIESALALLKAFGSRLSAMTIQSELGNNKHVALDVFAEGRFEISDMFSINTYANLKYTCPKNETRYYIYKKDPCSPCYTNAKYEADLEAGNQAVINCDLKFLEQQAINTLYPSAIKTKVSPGFSTELAISPHVTYEGWHFALGYDVWYQQREKIYLVNAKSSLLKTNIARKPLAYQSRIFTRLYKEIEKIKYDFAVGIQGDYCVDSIGIGQDFTFALSFEFNF